MDVVNLNKLSKLLTEQLTSAGVTDLYIKYILTALWLCVTLLVCWLANFITRKFITKALEKVIRKTKSKYDDLLVDRNVLSRIANLVPAVIIYVMLGIIFEPFGHTDIVMHLQKIVSSIIVFIILWAFIALLAVINDIYNTFSYAKERPIKGMIQIIQIAASFLTGIVIISILFTIDISKILTGLGATAAILLLIFKDTILGFVASIQLSANKMVSNGDWITMPTYKTDGTVIDISLNTVKVQNWDKTITTIPTYKMVEDSFINWKGMEQSGGRRIKRSVNIDMQTVKFCSSEMIERFKKIRLLKKYIQQKEEEIVNHNALIEGQSASESLANGRRLTNLGLFRRYLEEYLREHPMTLNNMTFMVRQLQSTEKGQPIEIYAFSKDQEWANYESIQADIFDHILAVVSEFDLKIYQLPSGADINLANYGNPSL
ncbi:mechanosensitive ion channel family protein [Carboxylicivirga sp. RSCT41]|uniref:mechanosensitive ion channel family protein n=1 Tax=Carboxylicivirga agarovorans TaxID=3417570 RepID=UPI003D352CC9